MVELEFPVTRKDIYCGYKDDIIGWLKTVVGVKPFSEKDRIIERGGGQFEMSEELTIEKQVEKACNIRMYPFVYGRARKKPDGEVYIELEMLLIDITPEGMKIARDMLWGKQGESKTDI